MIADSLLRGAFAAVRGGDEAHVRLTSALAVRYGASSAVLTDSGTSALVLALRLAAGTGGTVAYPAYGCVDLAAAARFAGVRVRLYDLDPLTLSPDLESVEAVLRRGVDAMVITHLFGFPADVPAVSRLAARYGAALIEDAAQGAAGRLGDIKLGGFGPLAVLSFGRGKGMTGGRGGALLAIGATAADQLANVRSAGPHRRGTRELAAAAAQWLLGRPSVYGIPMALPSLKLGEMVYHPAHEPIPLATSAAAMVRGALELADPAAARRRQRAAFLSADTASDVQVITSIAGGVSGMLRLPALISGDRPPASRLGVTAAYPRTLAEQPELRALLHQGETEHPGALHLRRLLRTIPVHDFVTARDLSSIKNWLDARDSSR
ncbi:MAG: DegT/DnrJ/EryC1/StrS family aminotransferase [Gemmatimonadaceae bacterium]